MAFYDRALYDKVQTVLDHKSGWLYFVRPECSVYEALEIMADHDIGALLVVCDSHLCGMFSERDYSRKLILQGKLSKETAVGEVMTSPPIVVGPDRNVEECMRIMTEFRIRHLPVVMSDVVVGILSIGDLVTWIIREQQEEIVQLHHYIAGVYPG